MPFFSNRCPKTTQKRKDYDVVAGKVGAEVLQDRDNLPKQYGRVQGTDGD